ncbi:MAG: acyl--CoA ligase, partial [Chloroherpetonaceae bacterium]|nr:acyl--CoA ligase [Chloroherpetonaceae bacterium]
MNKDLLFNAHMAHAVIIDGQTYLPTNYLVPYRNILELLTARAKKHKNDTFITFYASGGVSIRYTYDEFRRKVFQTANYLRAQGLIEESRVATISHNHIDTVVQYFAAWCAGITVVPINVGETPERIRYILENAEVSLAFVRDEYLPMVQELGLRITLLPSSEFEETISAYPDTFEQAQITDTRVQSQPAVNDSQATYADLETEALIVYTSGTTGLPKGVVLTQYNLLVDADAIAKWHNLQEGDVMMCVLPIHHVNGTVVTLLTPLYYGGSVVLN